MFKEIKLISNKLAKECQTKERRLKQSFDIIKDIVERI